MQGLGKGGAKRHSKVLRETIYGISKPAVYRLCRRAGVKRLKGSLIVGEIRGRIRAFLERLVKDAIAHTAHARRKTILTVDVARALRRRGRPLYGYSENERSRPRPGAAATAASGKAKA